MKWKMNSAKTIYDLTDNNLNICIHKIHGLEGWYLNCQKMNINDYDLDTTDFNEAVKKSQILISEWSYEIHKFATNFATNIYNDNEFIRY